MNQQESLFQEPGTTDPSVTGTKDTSTPFSGATHRGEDFATQLKAAQRGVSNLLILLLVVSGTLSILLLQEVRHDRADLAALKPQQRQMKQAQQLIADYNEKTVPAIRNFLDELGNYAQAHPSVMPILLKYGLAKPSTTPASAPGSQ